MGTRFRLASVLRARQAQEDAAKGEVFRAHGRTRAARDLTSRRELALRATAAPTGGPGRAVVAAIAARQSLAAGLAAAEHGIRAAEAEAAERVTALAEAAKRRRAVEKLAERHAAARAAREQAAEQAALDEIGTTLALRGDLA
jgi:flagellar protein FliJ